MATQMPPVPHFSLPTPGQQTNTQQPSAQAPQGMPPVPHFSLPGDTGQNTPTSDNFNGPGSVAISPLKHFAEGDPQSVLQQSAGALGALSDGNPFMQNMINSVPQMKQAKESLETNPTAAYKQGQGQTAGLGLLSPGGAGGAIANDVLPAMRAKNLAAAAKEMASPALTKKGVIGDLMSMKENPAIAKDAKVAQGLLENGVTKVGADAKATLHNSSALNNEIGSTAAGLEHRLDTMEVKPILQPEEINKILQDQFATIEKKLPPHQWANAKATAEWLWKKFIDKLPKNQEITAADGLRARKAADAEITADKGENIFDPATETGYSVALRAMRQGINTLVDSKAPGQGVKASLAHQTSLYNLLENVAEKGGTAVKKAKELENLPDLKGVMARHPLITNAVGAIGGSAATALGAGSVAKLLGYHLSQD